MNFLFYLSFPYLLVLSELCWRKNHWKKYENIFKKSWILLVVRSDMELKLFYLNPKTPYKSRVFCFFIL
jgi:hypothetical protein